MPGSRILATAAVVLGMMPFAADAAPPPAAPAPARTPAPTRPAPAGGAQATQAVPAPQPAACASGPKRALYVVLEAPVESDLAPMVDRCRALGYVKLGGEAHAVDVNPGSPAHDRFLQVVIVPAADGVSP